MKKLRLNEFPKTNNDLKRGKESQIWVYYVLIQQSPTLSTEDTFQPQPERGYFQTTPGDV